MLRRLIVEIHRRSLWQTLAVFAASSWVVLQVIDVLIQQGVLPAWVFKGGLFLLLLGLPVVLATAFVQEGGPAAGEPLNEAPSEAAGIDSSPSAPSPSADSASGAGPSHVGESPPHRFGAHRYFTWRNAILGGVGAFALLGVASAGYMTMRTMGIGSPGTLLAQGKLEEGAAVLLADFESPADAELGDVVTRTLRVDLLQSPAIRVLEPADLVPALERMQRDRSARITPELATELAEREGYAAVITGDIAAAGSGYVLTASILGGEGFRSLAGFRQTARSDAELVDAIERLSRAIRDKVGESLRSVRSGPSLAQVTTASLPALRAYTRAYEAEAVGDFRTALEEYERAVALDSTFAMAYRKVAANLANLGIRRPEMRHASRRAWELSHRLTEMERHLATGGYHEVVSGDIEAAARAYEQVLRIDPTNTAARNNLGAQYRHQGRFEEAERLLTRALQDESVWPLWGQLAMTRFSLGDYAGAMATLDSAYVALQEWNRAFAFQAQFAAAQGDFAAADSLLSVLEARASTPHDRTLLRQGRLRLATVRGRLREAERALDAPGGELQMADPAYLAIRRAELRLLRGDTAAAVRLVRETFAAHGESGDLEIPALLDVLIEARATTAAAELMAAWDSIVPPDERGNWGRIFTELMTGRVENLRGDHEAALSTLEALLHCCGGHARLVHYAIARTYDDMGQADRAIAAFEAGLAHQYPYRTELVELPYTLRRLGELYEATGDAEKAIEYYGRFVELWRDADPELQPRVREARERMERVRAAVQDAVGGQTARVRWAKLPRGGNTIRPGISGAHGGGGRARARTPPGNRIRAGGRAR